MTNINVVENKISELKKYLHIVNSYQEKTKEEIEKDITLSGAVERYLYLVVQVTIDTAEAVISYKNLRKPTIYSEVFEIMQEDGILEKKLTEKLKSMAGFRNILAHDYAKVDFDIVYNILQNQLTDIEEFIMVITKKIL